MSALLHAVTLASPFWTSSLSYGRYALELAAALSRRGLHVNTLGAGAPNRQFELTLTNLLIGYPTNHARYGTLTNLGTKVALCMWESTQMHADWIPTLNACAAVVVPCHWNEAVFRANGVTAPIHVLPLGLSDTFHYVERDDHRPLRFLLFYDRGERKGGDAGMDAFLNAFGRSTEVELVVKLRSALPTWHPLMNLGNPNIRVVVGDYDETAMQALYASCDGLIFGASGEAWGWPPREFAATGGIAFATHYGGLSEDISEWGMPIHYHPVPAWSQHPQHRGLGEWGQVDGGHLTSELKRVAALSYADRIALGAKFSANVQRLYRWDDYAVQLLALLEGLLEGDYADQRSA